MLTVLTARELLSALKRVEAELGRAQPVVRWGPRRIDLDLLLLDDLRVAEPDLASPHPGLTRRTFVLYP
jgi:2-amino-4-hydroxy-6-hydroxymethyldihydropteridine diphosphokinase